MDALGIRTEHRDPQPTLVVRSSASVAEIPGFLERTYHAVAGFLAQHGSEPAGPPFACYRMREEGRFDIEAGFPVAAPVAGAGDVHASTLPGGDVAVTVHVGPYDAMEPTYRALLAWVEQHDGQASAAPWEVYLTDPSAQPDPSTWRTEIVLPYRAG